MEISLTLTEEETEALRRLAARSGRTPEEEALIAIREYLDRAARSRAIAERVVADQARLLRRLGR